MKISTIRISFFFFILLLCGKASFSQEYWESEFWRDEVAKRVKNMQPIAGTYTTYYDNGKVKWTGKVLDTGIPDSTWIYYNEDGFKLWEGLYTGKVYIYHDFFIEGSQTLQEDTSTVGTYRNGVKHGEWLSYSRNGKHLLERGCYFNGNPGGVWEKYYVDIQNLRVARLYKYDYATQTKTFYVDDTINRTEHLDSLSFTADEDGNFKFRTGSFTADKTNIDIVLSAKYINLGPLNNFFRAPDHTGFTMPLYTIGLGICGGVNDEFLYGGNYNYIPPIYASPNDTIDLKLYGWNLSYVFGYDLIKVSAVDLTPTFSLGFQQLKLKVRDISDNVYPTVFNESEVKVFKNPAVFLDLSLHLRFNMGNITVNFAGGYNLDCTGDKWRYNGKYLRDSPSTSSSGLNLSGSIGLRLY